MTSIDSVITFLKVDDLDTSTRFYGDLLGLPLVLDQGPCRIFEATPSSYIGCCTHREASPATEAVIFTIVSREVDAWYERLVAAGVTFDGPPALNELFQIYHVFCRDPDGYLVEIQEFRDPRWPGPKTAAGLLEEARRRIKRLSPAEALAAMSDGALLIDTRSTEDRQKDGTIGGAIPVSLSVLEWRADPMSPAHDERIARLDQPIILISSDGYSSSLAGARLRRLGFLDVADVIDGFTAWKTEGLPFEQP